VIFVQLIDLQQARDLGEQALEQPDVSPGDARNRGQHFGVGSFWIS